MSRSVSESRYYEERPCEHDEMEEHYWMGYMGNDYHMCPGGSRREVTVDYEAAAKEYLFSTGRYEDPDLVWRDHVPVSVRVAAEEYSRRIVDAALGDTR